MVAAGVAVAIVIVFVVAYLSSNNPINPVAIKQDSSLDSTIEQSSSKIQGPSLTSQVNVDGTYKINTECELVYGIAYGVYPNGENLPGIKIDNLLANYPEEFKPWKEILQTPDNRTAFFKKPLSDEFRGVLTIALMKETFIDPKLEQIAMIVTDGQGKAKLQQAFQEFECQKYFDDRQKK